GIWLARFEAVTDVANRLDVNGIVRIGLDLRPQGGDAAVNTARRHDHGIAPNGVQDVIASERAPNARREVRQQAEFLGSELHFAAGAKELPRLEIQFEIAEAADGLRSRLSTPQEGVDARH